MKKFFTLLVLFLPGIFTMNSMLGAPKWSMVNFDNEDVYESFYVLTSFGDDHLFSLTGGNMTHIFTNAGELHFLNLINFTDWDTYLQGISSKTENTVVLWGEHINTFSEPFAEYNNVFYIVEKDTSKEYGSGHDKYKFKSHFFSSKYSGMLNIAYSGVNEQGNGITVLKNEMTVLGYSGWEEQEIYSDQQKTALCGAFYKDVNYIIVKTDNDAMEILKSSGGDSWNALGTIVQISEENDTDIKKLIINDDNDFYAISSTGFYYSKDGGASWQFKELNTLMINDAVIVNNSAMHLCGNNGFLCKVGLEDFAVEYYDSGTLYDLLTIYFTETGAGWAGGKNSILMKYDQGTDIDNEFYTEKPQISVSPNPASDLIEIAGEDFGCNNPVSICNMLGAEVYRFDSRGNSSKIDVSHLPAGIYFIRTGSRTAMFMKR